ncbi:unnamed protein product [Prorocentrum cordatum]|uniref:Uncharacterized protein n=1 Tax=Prorocentrum cordatum TaxID=2364126 RepID=A0ABN9QXV3_9DINO|nr:unnamed protein product [Polarella glacialis]
MGYPNQRQGYDRQGYDRHHHGQRFPMLSQVQGAGAPGLVGSPLAPAGTAAAMPAPAAAPPAPQPSESARELASALVTVLKQSQPASSDPAPRETRVETAVEELTKLTGGTTSPVSFDAQLESSSAFKELKKDVGALTEKTGQQRDEIKEVKVAVASSSNDIKEIKNLCAGALPAALFTVPATSEIQSTALPLMGVGVDRQEVKDIATNLDGNPMPFVDRWQAVQRFKTLEQWERNDQVVSEGKFTGTVQTEDHVGQAFYRHVSAEGEWSETPLQPPPPPAQAFEQ